MVDQDDSEYFSANVQLTAGLNQWLWDHQVDEQSAIAAEQAANQKAQEANEGAADEPLNRAKMPYAESQRLGHPPFVEPGKYQWVLQHGDNEHRVDFTVK